MKIFVSGQINDIENVRLVQQKLIDAGHEITHDWTRNETGDKMLGGDENKLANIDEASRRAVLDIDAVLDAEVHIACTDNELPGKGMYVELGAAIALNETRSSPRVFLVGKLNHMSIFYFHPSVKIFDTIDQVIEELK